MAALLSRRGTSHPRRAVGGGSFDRTAVTGLRDWWEASDLALSNNDPVPTWDGAASATTLTKTGTGSATYKTNVINSLPAVLFGTTWFQFDNDPGWAQPNTYFVVAGGSGGVYFDGTGASLRNLFYAASSAWRMFAGTEVVYSAFDTDFHVFTVEFDGASSVMRIDGVQVATGNTGTQTHQFFRVGASRTGGSHLVGHIAALAAVGGILSTGERDDVEDYLMTRYGIV